MAGAVGAGQRNVRTLRAAQLSLIDGGEMTRGPGAGAKFGDRCNFLALRGQCHYISVASGSSAGRKTLLLSPVQAPARLLAVMKPP